MKSSSNTTAATSFWHPNPMAALRRLNDFAPLAGVNYAQQRNFDYGRRETNNVSLLSPWLRHRLILEQRVLHEVLLLHHMSSAEKFIHEVFWRSYFKGWLEQRPEVWQRYCAAVNDWVDHLAQDSSLAERYEEAILGKTGIACFDHWAVELVERGYLHNHARMWFASIWIFTLKLPWELGADFFYRNLLDGDPASNTCSWRWVGGLHTQGKIYLASAKNIKKFTNDRFNPQGQLAVEAESLREAELAPSVTVNFDAQPISGARLGLLLTEEDCSPPDINMPGKIQSVLGLASATPRSVLESSQIVLEFATSAVVEATQKIANQLGCSGEVSSSDSWRSAIIEWSQANQLDAIIIMKAPLGPVQTRLNLALEKLEIPCIEIVRDYDRLTWPHATAGFFKFKKQIPCVLDSLNIT